MKKIAALLLATATLSLTAPASAEVKIGIIDTRKVLEESDAGKSLASQLKSRQEALQNEATAFEKKLKAEEEDIVSKRKDLKAEEFDARKKAFEQELQKSRQTVLTKSSDLDSARRKALGQLQQNLAKAAADIASAKQLNMILDRQFVVIAQPEMDMTAEVLKKLNETVKTIPLEGTKK
jgi:outer membrane protein